MKGEKVYRNPMVPVGNTGGIQVRATSLNLLSVLSTGVPITAALYEIAVSSAMRHLVSSGRGGAAGTV